MAKVMARLYPKEAAEPIATSVSILGERFHSALKPLIKNFWLMTITMAVSTISTMAMARAFSASTCGRGQPHITWPMETYISTSRKPSDHRSLRRSTGVSWSASGSPAAFSAWASASFTDAP